MAFQASILLPSSSPPKLPIKLFGQQTCRIERSLFVGNGPKTISKCAMKVSMSQFGGPDWVNMQINGAKEKLEKSLHELGKEVEWKRASDLLMSRLLSLAQKTLKWLVLALFALTSLSDIVLSISRNQELLIPLGLFVGCLMADLFKEIVQQVFPSSQGNMMNWKLIGIGFFFVLVKSVSVFFGSVGKGFLMHVANGGFMQVLWLWRNLVERTEEINQDDSMAVQDTLVPVEAEH